MAAFMQVKWHYLLFLFLSTLTLDYFHTFRFDHTHDDECNSRPPEHPITQIRYSLHQIPPSYVLYVIVCFGRRIWIHGFSWEEKLYLTKIYTILAFQMMSIYNVNRQNQNALSPLLLCYGHWQSFNDAITLTIPNPVHLLTRSLKAASF